MYMSQRRLCVQLADYEWMILVEAIDQYAYKNEDVMDLSGLTDFRLYIEQQMGLDRE